MSLARGALGALFVGTFVFFAPSSALAQQCAAGLAAGPVGCCNDTNWVQCTGNLEIIVACGDDLDANQGCIWNEGNGTYGCGDITSSPLVDPTGTFPRECSCTESLCLPTDECGTDGCGGSCGECTGASYCGYDDQTMLDNQCVCTPDCDGKFCGPDGCGGFCNEECINGQECYNPALGCEDCQPDCDGKICGPDGCGGTCDGGFDPCTPFNEVCSDDGTMCEVCLPQCDGKICGDDGCGSECGFCDPFETCSVDGTMCMPCAPDCAGKDCGDDTCGGTCGMCDDGEVCTAQSQCEVCTPDCTGKVCGDDGCGGSCGTCNSGTCTGDGEQCSPYACSDLPVMGCCASNDYLICGTGTIDIESCDDGGTLCGNDFNGTPGCYDPIDIVGQTDCPPACVPQCDGLECGDDGCGGTCGTCDEANNFTCSDAQICESMCPAGTPDCTGRVCGDDGCGGSCGTCASADDACTPEGQCVDPARSCDDVPADGCCEAGLFLDCDGGAQQQTRCSDHGQTCGGNSAGEPGCYDNADYAGPETCPCIPQCTDNACGPDGCGGTCGSCFAGQTCTSDNQCEYTFCPDLPGKRCCDGEVLSNCNIERGPFTVDCASRNQYCGWDENAEQYGCVDVADSIAPVEFGADRACPDAPICVPDCTGSVCGSDGCGGSCGVCADDKVCDFGTGQCIDETLCSELPPGGCCYTEPFYGVSVSKHLSCSSTDDYPSELQCRKGKDSTGRYGKQRCGWDGTAGRVGCVVYESAIGNTPIPPLGGPPPADLTLSCGAICIPECSSNDSCGPDGCGGVCGVCTEANEECRLDGDGTGGACVSECVPTCNGRTCGSDGCGGTCGACEINEECREYDNNQSSCVFVDACGDIGAPGCCSPQALKFCKDGLVRNSPGAIIFCGWDEAAGAYTQGRGVGGLEDPSGDNPRMCPDEVCTPYCNNRVCGTDGCGGSCGDCANGEFCLQSVGSLGAQCVDEGMLERFPDPNRYWSPMTQAGCCVDSLTVPDVIPVGVSTRSPQEVFSDWPNTGANGWMLTPTSDGASAQPCYSGAGGGCGYNAVGGRYECYYSAATQLPAVDPSGTYPRECAVPVCEPSCAGKNCGDDGCGGSCGVCPSDETCGYDGVCADNCGGVPARGSCNYSALTFCASGTVVEELCHPDNAFCGWNETLNAYSCGQTNGAPENPALYGVSGISNPDCAFPPGTCGSKAGCALSPSVPQCPAGTTCSVQGSVDEYGLGTCIPESDIRPDSCSGRCGLGVAQCSCSPGCEDTGYCCQDYASACNGAVAVPNCGDGFCHVGAGENCASCAADCDACPADNDSAPPWDSPYARVAVDIASGGENRLVLQPVDDVLPVPPPLLTDTLMRYMPAPGIDHAPRGGTSIVGVAPLSVAGRVGQAMRFFDASAATALPQGDVIWRPDGALPRVIDIDRAEPGGITVGMWVKIPETVDPQLLNALWTGWADFDTRAPSLRKCLWSRGTSQESLLMTCEGEADRLTGIKVVAGRIKNLPTAPDGSCRRTSDMGVENACLWEPSGLIVKKCGPDNRDCVNVSVPNQTIPGCADGDGYRTYVEGVCSNDTTAPNKAVALLVLPQSSGHVLALSTPSGAVVSSAPVNPGQWVHVGFTYQPLEQDSATPLGAAALYVDGAKVKDQAGLRFPRIGETRTDGVAKSLLSLDDSIRTAASGVTAELVADIDDLIVYGRALSDREFLSLRRKGVSGLRMAWPERGASYLVDNDDDGLSLVDVEAPHLTDRGAPGGTRPLRRDERAVRVDAGRVLEFIGEDTHDLGGLDRFTLMTWVRKLEDANTEVLEVTQSGTRLEVARTAACGGTAITATFGSQVLTQTACQARFETGVWTQLTLTQDASKRRVYVDGVLAVEANVDQSQALFDTQGTPRLRFNDIDVFWAGLFQRAMDADDVTLWRGQGPAVWLDGATWSDDGETRPRDYALYTDRSTDETRHVALWSGGQPNTAAPTEGPLTLSADAALTVPLDETFGRLAGTETLALAPRKFSVAARILNEGAGPWPLVDRRVVQGGQHTSVFSAELHCTDANQCRVRGRALVSGPDVGSTDELHFVTAYLDFQAAPTEYDVALAFDGRSVYVALGALGGSEDAPLAASRRLDVTESLQNRNLPLRTTALPLTGSYLYVAPTAGQTLTLRELRVYPRAISTVELVRLARRDCNDAGCDARGLKCVVGSGSVLPMCSGCSGGNPLSSGAGGACLARTAFMGQCQHDQECATGLCATGRCLQPPKLSFTPDGIEREGSEGCQTYCTALGRTCVEKASDAWGCSRQCLDYHYGDESGLNDDWACVWAPARVAGELCEVGDECRAGACSSGVAARYDQTAWTRCLSSSGLCTVSEANDGAYDVWASVNGGPFEFNEPHCLDLSDTSDVFVQAEIYGGKACPPYFLNESTYAATPAVCADEDTQRCTGLNRQTTALRVEQKGARPESTAYKCGGCLDTTFNGQPLYRVRRELMTESACQLVSKKIIQKTVDYRDKSFKITPDRRIHLRELNELVNGTKELTPASYAKLETLGFGPYAMAYNRQSYEEQVGFAAVFGSLPTYACSIEPESVGNFDARRAENPYYAEGYNQEICVPNKFPNGTPCPPPGYNKEGGNSPHDFCESGFCARDTGLCETGFARIEQTDAENRSDNKDSEDGDLLVDLKQTNRVSMVVRKNGTLSNGTTAKRDVSITSTVDNTLSFFGAKVSVLRLEHTLHSKPEEQKGTYAAKAFLLGLQIPLGDPAVQCPGDTIVNGEVEPAEGGCNASIAPGNLLPSPPVVKTCLPNPFACKPTDWKSPEAFFANTTAKGKMCVQKTYFAGPVPITMRAALFLDPCVAVGLAVDAQTFEPAFKVVPGVSVGVELRGGVGGSVGPVEVFAGVRAALTILGLDFPMTWGVKVEKRTQDPDGHPIENLFVTKFQRDIAFEATMLKLVLSFFAEAGIGPFSVEWDKIIFQFAGFVFHETLASDEIFSKKIDLEHPLTDL